MLCGSIEQQQQQQKKGENSEILPCKVSDWNKNRVVSSVRPQTHKTDLLDTVLFIFCYLLWLSYFGLGFFVHSKQLPFHEKQKENKTLNLHMTLYPCSRYNILNPNITKEKDGSPMDEKKASSNLLDESKLDVSLFRLGHTKARCCFHSPATYFACEHKTWALGQFIFRATRKMPQRKRTDSFLEAIPAFQ